MGGGASQPCGPREAHELDEAQHAQDAQQLELLNVRGRGLVEGHDVEGDDHH